MLTVQTRANYRVQCRRLWEIYKMMLDDDDRKPALRAQIEKLCDKLGYEVDRLDVILYTSLRGRPRINPDVTDLDARRKELKADPLYWTPEAIERRAQIKRDESARKLQELMSQGGDNEGSKSTTDEVGEVGGTDQSTRSEHGK